MDLIILLNLTLPVVYSISKEWFLTLRGEKDMDLWGQFWLCSYPTRKVLEALTCSMFELSPLTALSLAPWSVSSDLCALSPGGAEEFTVGAVGGLVSEERVALQKEKKTKPKDRHLKHSWLPVQPKQHGCYNLIIFIKIIQILSFNGFLFNFSFLSIKPLNWHPINIFRVKSPLYFFIN